MTMQDVTFSWSKVMSGEIGSVTVKDGHGRASLPIPDLTRAFDAVAEGVEIELDEDGLTVRLGPLQGSAQLTLEGTNLVLRVPQLDRNFKVGLPRFVDGLKYRKVRISGADAVVEFSLRDSRLREL
jgi:hypothetical protein